MLEHDTKKKIHKVFEITDQYIFACYVRSVYSHISRNNMKIYAILNIQENGTNTEPKNQLKIQYKICAQAKTRQR